MQAQSQKSKPDQLQQLQVARNGMLLVGAVWPAVMHTMHRKEKIHHQSSLFEQSWNERRLGAMNSRCGTSYTNWSPSETLKVKPSSIEWDPNFGFSWMRNIVYNGAWNAGGWLQYFPMPLADRSLHSKGGCVSGVLCCRSKNACLVLYFGGNEFMMTIAGEIFLRAWIKNRRLRPPQGWEDRLFWSKVRRAHQIARSAWRAKSVSRNFLTNWEPALACKFMDVHQHVEMTVPEIFPQNFSTKMVACCQSSFSVVHLSKNFYYSFAGPTLVGGFYRTGLWLGRAKLKVN